jgi:2',3'-cyclic-nucleotide 2'-phosphodiesterase (5'-nucleotidase family)
LQYLQQIVLTHPTDLRRTENLISPTTVPQFDPGQSSNLYFAFDAMSSFARVRLVAINDVYELTNLPKLQTFLSTLTPLPTAVILAGDFLSPSPLSSIDGGRGMVATLRAVGLTHCSFGNHEADLKLGSLHERVSDLARSVKVLNSNMRNPPEKAAWMASLQTKPYDIIQSPCHKVRVALIGLFSDEPGMTRDGTFKGVPIDNMERVYGDNYRQLVPELADFIIPITHASIGRDQQLASYMAAITGDGLIIGGHEHEPIDEIVKQNGADVRILKGGTDARSASLIDLQFDTSFTPAQLTSIDYALVDLLQYEGSVVVRNIADSHMSVIAEMENEIIADCNSMLPPGKALSSERTRFQQTTMGAFFCQAIKEELEADVALINGATIKGGATYSNNTVSYAELRKELPFPTKMVVVQMTRAELENAIHYSRTHSDDGESIDVSVTNVPRRGYLQVDWDYDLSLPFTGSQDDILQVAVPRNLLAGFCNIRPLMSLGHRLREEKLYPGADDFVPALDLVVRYCSKHRWSDILRNAPKFDDMDLNHDGVLDRHEVKLMMTKLLGKEPPDFVVDDMISSIDEDENGVIDVGEFSYLLATAERSQRW